MKDLLPILMLAIVMITGYFMGRRDGLKMYWKLLKEYDSLQLTHNELLKAKWNERPSNEKDVSQNYWDKEKDFYDSRRDLK